VLQYFDMQLQKYKVLSTVDSTGDRTVTSTVIETVVMQSCGTNVFQTEVLVKGLPMIGNIARTLGRDSYCVEGLQEPAASKHFFLFGNLLGRWLKAGLNYL
jgi:hypothetical protein